MSAASAVNIKSFHTTVQTNNTHPGQNNEIFELKKSILRPKSAIHLRNNTVVVVNEEPRSRFTHASLSIRPVSAHIKIKTGGLGMRRTDNRFGSKGGTGDIFIL
jgi:hypothetical protein